MELSRPRRCAKVEAAIKWEWLCWQALKDKARLVFWLKEQAKLYLTQKVNVKLQLLLGIFIEDKERSTRLGEKDIGVLSRLFLS